MNLEKKKIGEGERLIMVLDDHWVSILTPILLFLVGWAMTVLIVLVTLQMPAEAEVAAFVFYLVAFAIASFASHWFFIYLLEWELSTWVVTTRRIIDIRFLPYVKHDTRFFMIDEIHEVEKHKRGIIQNILNYGDVEINLAAVHTTKTFKFVPRPGPFVNLLQTIHKSKSPDDLDLEALRRVYHG